MFSGRLTTFLSEIPNTSAILKCCQRFFPCFAHCVYVSRPEWIQLNYGSFDKIGIFKYHDTYSSTSSLYTFAQGSKWNDAIRLLRVCSFTEELEYDSSVMTHPINEHADWLILCENRKHVCLQLMFVDVVTADVLSLSWVYIIYFRTLICFCLCSQKSDLYASRWWENCHKYKVVMTHTL